MPIMVTELFADRTPEQISGLTLLWHYLHWVEAQGLPAKELEKHVFSSHPRSAPPYNDCAEMVMHTVHNLYGKPGYFFSALVGIENFCDIPQQEFQKNLGNFIYVLSNHALYIVEAGDNLLRGLKPQSDSNGSECGMTVLLRSKSDPTVQSEAVATEVFRVKGAKVA